MPPKLDLTPEDFFGVLGPHIHKHLETRRNCQRTTRDSERCRYLEGQVPNKDLPAFIVVECLNYVGPPFFTKEEKKKWVPIVPSKFHDDSFKESRTGYALRLAYAMIIHKSQGESLAMICVDIDNIMPINSQGRRNSRLG
jgi:hypothetical protein